MAEPTMTRKQLKAKHQQLADANAKAINLLMEMIDNFNINELELEEMLASFESEEINPDWGRYANLLIPAILMVTTYLELEMSISHMRRDV